MTMKRILLFVFAAGLTIALGSCAKNQKPQQTAAAGDSTQVDDSAMLGSWTMPDPIDTTKTMGVKLEAGGKASSINMATLPYSTWKILNDTTIEITGVSKGNGQDINIKDTFIVNMKVKPMTMQQKGADVLYTKE